MLHAVGMGGYCQRRAVPGHACANNRLKRTSECMSMSFALTKRSLRVARMYGWLVFVDTVLMTHWSDHDMQRCLGSHDAAKGPK